MSGSLLNHRYRPVLGARAGLEGQRRRWASRMRPTDDGAITRSCTCAPALPSADPRRLLGRSEVCGAESRGGVNHHQSDHASSGTRRSTEGWAAAPACAEAWFEEVESIAFLLYMY